MAEVQNCPVCKSDNAQITQLGALNDAVSVNCGTCGRYRVSFMTQLRISEDVRERSTESSVLSYYIRRMQTDESTEPVLTDAMVEEFLKRQLPSAAEQADNFVLWVGDRTPPGQTQSIQLKQDYPLIGAHLDSGLWFIISGLMKAGLIDSNSMDRAALSFDGWRRYHELKKGQSDSKKAFMAMPFGNPAIDALHSRLKQAVSETGFDLRRLDEKPKAGLIDDRLRVEIRTSRFLVVGSDGRQPRRVLGSWLR